jgi:hypothetical protein
MGLLVTFKIELTADDVKYIGGLLDERPHKEVSDLVKRVQVQIDTQQAAARAEANAEQKRQLDTALDKIRESAVADAMAKLPKQKKSKRKPKAESATK